MGKKHGPEEIIGKLREAEIVLAQGGLRAMRAAGSAFPSKRITGGARSLAV